MTQRPSLAVIGGTGDLGGDLAWRWAQAGYRVIIGSRSAEKAVASAIENGKTVTLEGVGSLRRRPKAETKKRNPRTGRSINVPAKRLPFFKVGKVALTRTVPLAFTASETFDVGADLGSTVSLSYLEKRPFEFDGKIHSVNVRLK